MSWTSNCETQSRYGLLVASIEGSLFLFVSGNAKKNQDTVEKAILPYSTPQPYVLSK